MTTSVGANDLVEPEHGLAAQVARRARHDVAEDADRVADAGSADGEQAADDALQRVQAELETRGHAEVAAAGRRAPRGSASARIGSRRA